MRELPIACELTANEIAARREGLLPGLVAHAQERIDLPAGFRWRFVPGSEVLSALTQAIDLERQCCKFLSFVLIIEPDAGPIWLEVTGPPGTAEFLKTLVKQ